MSLTCGLEVSSQEYLRSSSRPALALLLPPSHALPHQLTDTSLINSPTTMAMLQDALVPEKLPVFCEDERSLGADMMLLDDFFLLPPADSFPPVSPEFLPDMEMERTYWQLTSDDLQPTPSNWPQYFSPVIKEVPSGLSGDGLDYPLSDGEFNQLLLAFTNLPPAELSDEDWLNLPVEVGAAPFEEGVDECQDLEEALKSIDSIFGLPVATREAHGTPDVGREAGIYSWSSSPSPVVAGIFRPPQDGTAAATMAPTFLPIGGRGANAELPTATPTTNEDIQHPSCAPNSPKPTESTIIDLTGDGDEPNRGSSTPHQVPGLKRKRETSTPEPKARNGRDGELRIKSPTKKKRSRRQRIVLLRPEEVTLSIDKRNPVYHWNQRSKVWEGDSEQLIVGEPLGNLVQVLKVRPGVDKLPFFLIREPGEAVFAGRNVDGQTISMPLWEVKEMLRNPSGRKYVGDITM